MDLTERRARHAANQRAWRARHPERAREVDAAWRAAHPEELRAHKALDYQRHGARRRATSRAWRLANLDRAQARERAWKASHRAEMAAYRRDWLTATPTREQAVRAATTANRRARLYDADGVLTYENVLEIWRLQPTCVGCGVGRGLDHVIPFFRGGSNTSGNLQNLCPPCNAAKGVKLPDEVTR